MTKQFTATAILILQDQGEVDIFDPICNFIVDCPTTWQEITIHHLLTHTSGIPNYDYWDLESDQSQGSAAWSPEAFVTVFKDLPLDFQPGKNWSYSNSGYVILGYIIEQISGQSYETFLRQSIFNPLNMDATGYFENADDWTLGYLDRYTTDPVTFTDVSILFASGGLHSTLEDLFQWNRALHSEQLLPQTTMDQMFTPYAVTGDGGEGYAAYGYGWFLHEHKGHAVVWHGGSIDGFTSILAYHPDEQVAVILLSNIDREIVNVEYLGGTISDKIFGEE